MSIWTGSPSAGRMLSIFRIIVGLLFIGYGTMKLFGYPPMPGPGGPLPPLLRMAGSIEVVGGTLILLGLLTRPVAFVLSGEMAVAYFKSHFPHSFFPQVNGGMPAVLFCFIYLYMCVAGGGAWSIDALITKRRSGGESRSSSASRPSDASSLAQRSA